MNYRHIFHAGNFADVVKHVALVRVLLHLSRKDTPFAVIDTHAGRGIYDLAGDEAQRTGEAANGIEKLHGLEGPEALARYLALVEASGDHTYPGSPLIAAKLLRPQDRLVAIEKHPEEAQILEQVLSIFRKARVEHGDGYARLAAVLPPQERRGVVLIDPPFEAPDEFEAAAAAVKGAVRRFATGIYLIWYPVKSAAAARAFRDEVLTSGVASALNIEIAVEAAEGRLGRAGLLVLNPPFGFDGDMQAILALVAPRLPGGRADLAWVRAPRG
jgi:23S rRNA (adenine2030-N6)-methyltransferase